MDAVEEYRARVGAAESHVDDVFAAAGVENRRQAGVFVARQMVSERALQIVTLALVSIVGVLAFSEVSTSLPIDTGVTDFSNATDLENAATNLSTDFGSAIELFGPVMIIIVAAIILSVVRGF